MLHSFKESGICAHMHARLCTYGVIPTANVSGLMWSGVQTAKSPRWLCKWMWLSPPSWSPPFPPPPPPPSPPPPSPPLPPPPSPPAATTMTSSPTWLTGPGYTTVAVMSNWLRYAFALHLSLKIHALIIVQLFSTCLSGKRQDARTNAQLSIRILPPEISYLAKCCLILFISFSSLWAPSGVWQIAFSHILTPSHPHVLQTSAICCRATLGEEMEGTGEQIKLQCN